MPSDLCQQPVLPTALQLLYPWLQWEFVGWGAVLLAGGFSACFRLHLSPSRLQLLSVSFALVFLLLTDQVRLGPPFPLQCWEGLKDSVSPRYMVNLVSLGGWMLAVWPWEMIKLLCLYLQCEAIPTRRLLAWPLTKWLSVLFRGFIALTISS